ncbi:MAG: extensin family protein [Pseudomonadota bacterium]
MTSAPNPQTPSPVPPRHRRRRYWLIGLLPALLGLIVGFFVLREGLLPARFTPLPLINIDDGSTWLTDWRLRELKYDRALCRRAISARAISARPVPDRPLINGCGWVNAVRVRNVGGARLNVRRLSCETAAATAMWVAHDVQPVAREIFGVPVTAIRHGGVYSCRNIVGSRFWAKTRSEHASANAIDISGFTLANGQTISLARDWTRRGKKARFLREIHRRSCRYFRVSLGPNFNRAHHDHFHFDRGLLSTCR